VFRAVDRNMPARPATQWEHHMARFSAIRIPSTSKTPKSAPGNVIRAALAAILASAAPAFAAGVTAERLLNPDREPQNWLMNHRTYDGQRFSPLARIDKSNVKNLKLAYAVPLGGSTGDEWLEATPLFENGFIYVTDSWGVLYKIDATSGEAGQIVWRMVPKQERQANSRGAALWGNLVISPANWPARIIATDKQTGRVVWETNVSFRYAATAHHGGTASHQGQDRQGRIGRRQRRA
jgi:glucose dehydrogenase